MKAVVYISKAMPDFKLSEIISMLENAKQFNKKEDITGCILYHKKTFIQIIEGEAEKIDALYYRIKKDQRHERVTTLYDGPLEKRLFGQWSMVFYEFSGDRASLHYKRLLFENYIESATISASNQRVFRVFRLSSEKLLQTDFKDLFEVVEIIFPDREGQTRS